LSDLKQDGWLSNQLGRPAFACHPPFAEDLSLRLSALPAAAFVFARVPTQDTEAVFLLQRNGFRLVDTTLTFHGSFSDPRCSNRIRSVEPRDAQGSAEIARDSYRYSRFHLDPMIPDLVARDLKASWVGNFFRGARGDRMLVAEGPSGELAGFVLGLTKEDCVVIDLIAVSPQFQRQGVAADLVQGLASCYPPQTLVSAGTQAANIGSVRFYESQGFRLASSAYVFHYHA
jgi:dTDP-4-amino-4,6-dideoxy-D-galactose acyltransferase